MSERRTRDRAISVLHACLPTVRASVQESLVRDALTAEHLADILEVAWAHQFQDSFEVSTKEIKQLVSSHLDAVLGAHANITN